MSLDLNTVELILVRHGQTDWNAEKRCQGAMDESRLTPQGVEQARELANALKRFSCNALISSGQTRSIQTAEIIAEALNLPVRLDPRLGEMAQGMWEGMLFPDIEREHGPSYQQFLSDPLKVVPPGGESIRDLSRRVSWAARDIAAQHVGQRVIVISHEIPLAALRCLDANQPLSELWKYAPANGEITHLDWPVNRPDWFVIFWRWISQRWRLAGG